jgi:hypothetical protein
VTIPIPLYMARGPAYATSDGCLRSVYTCERVIDGVLLPFYMRRHVVSHVGAATRRCAVSGCTDAGTSTAGVWARPLHSSAVPSKWFESPSAKTFKQSSANKVCPVAPPWLNLDCRAVG